MKFYCKLSDLFALLSITSQKWLMLQRGWIKFFLSKVKGFFGGLQNCHGWGQKKKHGEKGQTGQCQVGSPKLRYWSPQPGHRKFGINLNIVKWPKFSSCSPATARKACKACKVSNKRLSKQAKWQHCQTSPIISMYIASPTLYTLMDRTFICLTHQDTISAISIIVLCTSIIIREPLRLSPKWQFLTYHLAKYSFQASEVKPLECEAMNLLQSPTQLARMAKNCPFWCNISEF